MTAVAVARARGRARARLSRHNWKPRLYIVYLRRVGCGKGAAMLAAILFG
jgi:hypothetical protein